MSLWYSDGKTTRPCISVCDIADSLSYFNFYMGNYPTSILENFRDVFSQSEENSVEFLRNDIALFYFQWLKWEWRFLMTANEVHGLIVSPSISENSMALFPFGSSAYFRRGAAGKAVSPSRVKTPSSPAVCNQDIRRVRIVVSRRYSLIMN